MTIDEMIASYEKSAERYRKAFLHCKAHGGAFYQSEAESNKICYEHNRQLATWLKELLEYKSQPKIIYCKECKHCKATEFSTGRKGFMCMKWILETDSDWYCSRAERETE